MRVSKSRGLGESLLCERVAPLFFYRDKDKKEIDLLLEINGKLIPIEIKKKHHQIKMISKISMSWTTSRDLSCAFLQNTLSFPKKSDRFQLGICKNYDGAVPLYRTISLAVDLIYLVSG